MIPAYQPQLKLSGAINLAVDLTTTSITILTAINFTYLLVVILSGVSML